MQNLDALTEKKEYGIKSRDEEIVIEPEKTFSNFFRARNLKIENLLFYVILPALVIFVFGSLFIIQNRQSLSTGQIMYKSPRAELPTQTVTSQFGDSTKIDNFRASILVLSVRYTETLSASLKSSIDKHLDREVIRKSLNGQNKELSTLIGNYYGKNLEEKFLNIWQSNTDNIFVFSDSVINNNRSMQESALRGIESSSIQLSEFLEEINDLMPKDKIFSFLTTFHNSMYSFIKYYLQGDTTRAQVETYNAVEAIKKFAETISESTIQKFPHKFYLE